MLRGVVSMQNLNSPTVVTFPIEAYWYHESRS